MTEPTKGPWAWQKESFGDLLLNDQRVVIVASSEIGRPTTANANLIAAAPDLLAALVAIRECTFIDSTKMLDTPCQDCMDAVDAAIAKAKGEPCPTE